MLKIKYSRLSLLLLTVVIAAVLFYEGRHYVPLHDLLMSLGYIGTFFAGVFYAFGFTSAPATAILLVLAKEQNLVLSVLVGGLGALLSDILIFLFIRYSFMGEIKRLKREKIVRYVAREERILLGRYYKYVFPALTGFLIASPLPTEIGVSMMASMKRVSWRKFLVIAYVLHTLGVFLILVIGNVI